MTQPHGKKVWLIADCYYPGTSQGAKSHDAACVLNTGDQDAHLTLTLYFEDREPVQFISSCPAQRTHHIRLDKLSQGGISVPTDVPYALLIESSCPVIVQYSRLDTSLGGMALMTTMAYPSE